MELNLQAMKVDNHRNNYIFTALKKLKKSFEFLVNEEQDKSVSQSSLSDNSLDSRELGLITLEKELLLETPLVTDEVVDLTTHS